jgi:hypothetical protein
MATLDTYLIMPLYSPMGPITVSSATPRVSIGGEQLGDAELEPDHLSLVLHGSRLQASLVC